MTATLTRTAPRPARTVELVLARAHLRLGSLALARVELETLAGLGRLDTAGLADLAEVRWRTGDLLGAGEAAGAALRNDEEMPVALVIAAEAAAALGRPSESRRLARRAMACAPSIDLIFAGMPRSSVWPGDADEPPPSAPTLFDRAPEEPAAPNASTPHEVPSTAASAAAPTDAAPVALGFWDDDEAIDSGAGILPDPALELEAGRSALVAGRLDQAVLRFGVALRLAPALAPAVLEATEGARASNLLMVRGDAFRLVGHETEARQAYAAAAGGGLPERRRRTRPKGEDPQPGATAEVAADAADDEIEGPPAPTAKDAQVPATENAETETPAVDGAGTDAAVAPAPPRAEPHRREAPAVDELFPASAETDSPAATGDDPPA
jgi:tetratricopeptide (TPR) repeat protein